MKILILPLYAVCLLLFSSCQNVYRQSPPPVQNSPQGMIGVSGDAYQVTIDEYGNYFESRYGLLHQKLNDMPFTGRILIIEKGDSGEFVASDESWSEGRKDGLSTRWFSNGIKMYERNYKEGRWHGPVTRWWPNGQKMYVRAYTNGARHGKEATWRSDGSPIKLADEPYLQTDKFEPVSPANSEAVATDDEKDGFESQISVSPQSTANEVTESAPFPDLPSGNPTPEESIFPALPVPEAAQNDFVAPAGSNPSTDLPSFSAPDPVVDSSVFPELPSNESSEDLPALPVSPAGSDDFPPLPGLGGADSELPALPATSDGDTDDLTPLPPPSGDSALPPLPGLDSSGDDLPPLPGMPDASGDDLPPLPPISGDGGGLPPLPAFPE